MAKILIIDDAADVRTLLGVCFLHAGHTVVVANDGAAGLAAVATHAPDLVITDLTMPVLDGLAFVRHLRADGQRGLPVVMLTAHAAQRMAALAAGVDIFLVKPVTLDRLVATAERLLTERRALHAAE